MPNVELNFETILLLIAVVLLIANSISSLNKGRKDWRELSGIDRRSKELSDMKDRIKKLEDGMTEVEKRLEQGEKNFDKISKDTEQIMNVLDGLLMHFISGNDIETLKSVKNEMDRYKSAR